VSSVIGEYRKLLDDGAEWAAKSMVEAKKKELDLLSSTVGSATSTVVVVGNTGTCKHAHACTHTYRHIRTHMNIHTGAGKSTLLNALLGEKDVLPTNGMRACTAVLIELSYNQEGSDYRGAVEFISEMEWLAELDALLEDLTQQDGRAILSVHDTQAFNYNSWCKVYAVYGSTYTHSRERNDNNEYKSLPMEQLREKLLKDRSITGMLGSTQTVQHKKAALFRKQLERFCDSSDDVEEVLQYYLKVIFVTL
jgi:hypothetical protein